MDQERSAKVRVLFHDALELEPEDRLAFLDTQCEGDLDLRREVQQLLDCEPVVGTFLETPATAFSTITTAPMNRQFGAFRIVSLLGAGGMGEVYRAHDAKLGRDVAIKTLPAEFARDPERLARLRREARTLASLNHPNIASIYGLEEAGGLDCLVMELVEGEALRGPLAMAQALDFARQIADALEAAHDKGIIHRDLKPANVKVTPQGKVKVLDFGLAKAVLGAQSGHDLSQVSAGASHSLEGHIIGTPGYMSPEQARGQQVDQRTDIWAFGCVLYELLTGKRAFQRDTLPETIEAVLTREPDWQALPAKIPAKIRKLLGWCLQKDPARRLESIGEARRIIERTRNGRSRWRIAAAAGAAFAVVAASAAVWSRSPVRPSDQSKWVQLTKFSDSVSQPALSPDGRTVAFIRGASTFFGRGQIYVKILPDGEPVQLTHDELAKMSPAFSPDGTRVAYTTVNANFEWDTWTVPVLGGEPQLMLKNASGLVWTGPQKIQFSEIRMGVHMAVVASDENRMNERSIYIPPDEPDMAHRSYLSPDGNWVLLVEMDIDHLWEPCRVVPANGSSSGMKVGPPGGGCTFGAWSADGKWMYLTSNAVSGNHIWRQRFPDGKPEQITAGPTEEEGISMAADGRSLVTAVSLQNASLWVHDSNGERQISLEGNAASTMFTPDGKKLLYRIVREPPSEFQFYRDSGQVMIADLRTGHSEPLVPGLQVLNFDISRDGQQVVMEAPDSKGRPRLWLAALDRSSPPRQIPNVEGGDPRFAPDGSVYFRHNEGASTVAGSLGFIYSVRPDGSGLRKAIDAPVNNFYAVSPDGRWVEAWAPLPGNGPAKGQVFSLEGKPAVTVGGKFGWAGGGATIGFDWAPYVFYVPLAPGRVLPGIPAGGFHSDEEIATLPGVRKIEGQQVVVGPSPDVYAFYRGTIQRNLYRIPIP